MENKNTQSNNFLLWVLACFVVAVALATYFNFIQDSGQVVAARHLLKADQTTLRSDKVSVGTQWKWDDISDEQIKKSLQNKKTNEEPNPLDKTENTPLDVVTIYTALQKVELTESGDVVIDNSALNSLQRFVNINDVKLNQAGLDELASVIQAGLPGEAGGKVSKIVTDFYHYQVEKQALDKTVTMPNTPEELRSYYETLQTLREKNLGYDVADKLFSKEDNQTLFTIESMTLGKDESLPQEEKDAKQQELREKYLPATPDIANWESRLQTYKEAKSKVMEAGLESQQQHQQIKEIYRQHFSQDERQKITAFGLNID